MEVVSKTRLIERLARKGLFGLANIVEMIFQRIPLKASGEVQATTAMDSAFSLRGLLAARQAMPEIELSLIHI